MLSPVCARSEIFASRPFHLQHGGFAGSAVIFVLLTVKLDDQLMSCPGQEITVGKSIHQEEYPEWSLSVAK